MPQRYLRSGSQVPHQQQFCSNNSDLERTGHELFSLSLPDRETAQNRWKVRGRKWWKRSSGHETEEQEHKETFCTEIDWQIRRAKVKMSPWLPGCVFGYLWPASSVHVGADGVVRACSTHIQVGPVPRLNQTDEVSTFPLREGMTKPNRIRGLGQK